MEQEIPKIQFAKNKVPDIQVMSFAQLSGKLKRAVDHDPYIAHRIEFHLILVVSHNTYSHFVDFKSYDLSKGSAIFVAKNQVHHFTESINKAEGVSIVIKSDLIEQYHFRSNSIKLNRLFNYHIGSPTISPADFGEDSLVEIGNLMYSEFRKDIDFAKTEMMRTLLHILLLRAERLKEACSNTEVNPHWFEIFNGFKKLLESDYVNIKDARTYAKKLLISYKFLNEIVKKINNKTAKAFIDHYVTIEIKRYLASTSLSIKEIAYTVGFEEPANMNKFFKRNTDITPQVFRQQL